MAVEENERTQEEKKRRKKERKKKDKKKEEKESKKVVLTCSLFQLKSESNREESGLGLVVDIASTRFAGVDGPSPKSIKLPMITLELDDWLNEVAAGRAARGSEEATMLSSNPKRVPAQRNVVG